jgi:rare lipoprotein A
MGGKGAYRGCSPLDFSLGFTILAPLAGKLPRDKNECSGYPTMRAVRILIPLLLAAAVPAFCLQEGLASWYGGKFHGRLTSSGEVFDTNDKTAAHKSLPFGTIVKVTNLDNGKYTTVKINDRGPFVEGRIIDLSRAAAEELGMLAQGVARVSIDIVDFVNHNDLFTLQAGAYSLEKNAQAAARRIQGAGFVVSLEKTPIGITRILVRGLSEKEIPEAQRKLAALGFTKLVVRREKSEIREASAR